MLQARSHCTIMAWPVSDLAIVRISSCSEGSLVDAGLSIPSHDGFLLGASCVGVVTIPFSFALPYSWMRNTQAVIAKCIAVGLPRLRALEGLHNTLTLNIVTLPQIDFKSDSYRGMGMHGVYVIAYSGLNPSIEMHHISICPLYVTWSVTRVLKACYRYISKCATYVSMASYCCHTLGFPNSSLANVLGVS